MLSAYPPHPSTDRQPKRGPRVERTAHAQWCVGYLWKNGWNTGAFFAPLYPDVLSELRQWHANGKQIAIFSSGSVDAQKLLFGHVGTAEDNGDLAASNEAVTESSEKKRKSDEATTEEPKADAKDEVEAEEPPVKKHKASEPAVDPPARLPGVQQKEHEIHRPYLGEDINDMIVDYFDTQNAGPKQEAASYEKIAKALGKPCNEILFLSDNVKGMCLYLIGANGKSNRLASCRGQGCARGGHDVFGH